MYKFKEDKRNVTTLTLCFKAGAIYEEKGSYGTMHLLEHLICKSFMDLQKQLAIRGISYNASTNNEYVSVFFSGLNTQLTPELKEDLTKRLCSGLVCDEKEFEKEKDIVKQELLSAYKDKKDIIDLFSACFNFNGAMGNFEDIEKFKLSKAKEVYDKFFRIPDFILECGPEKTPWLERFGENEPVKHEQRKIMWTGEKPKNETEKNIDNVKIYLVSKNTVSKEDYPYLSIAMRILSNSRDSILHDELRQKRGLVYSESCIKLKLGDYVYFINATRTTKDNVEKVLEIYKDTFNHVDTLISEENFNDTIQMLKCKRELSEIDDPMSKLISSVKNWTLPEDLNTISYEKVLEVSKRLLDMNNIEIVTI